MAELDLMPAGAKKMADLLPGIFHHFNFSSGDIWSVPDFLHDCITLFSGNRFIVGEPLEQNFLLFWVKGASKFPL